jgi:inhibitor of nuclear factor kappa-B kinase subunit alpha
MPLSDIDKHAIEVIYLEKKWNAGRIVKEFPSKGWKKSTVHDLIKKIEETGSSDRRPGSGRPRTALTDEKLPMIKHCVISDPGNPGTSKSVRETAQELGISGTSVQRGKKQLGIKTFRRIVTPRITQGTKERRLERAEGLADHLDPDLVPYCVFYDEKDFTLERPINRQNNRVSTRDGGDKREISPERLFFEKSHFSKKIMVCAAVSYRGKSNLLIVDPAKTKVDSGEYQRVLKKLFPAIRKLYPEEDWIFIQDGAPSHRSQSTQSFLVENCPAFVGAEEWPPNSPDCNPLDYSIWNSLKEKTYRGRANSFQTLEELSDAVKDAWKQISLDEIQASIDQFLPRVQEVVNQHGGPIQHLMQ